MKECLYCGKPVKNKYCNTICQNKDRKGKPKSKKSIEKMKKTIENKWVQFDVTCKYCGKEFKIMEFNVSEKKKEFYYCSKSCSNHRKQLDTTKEKIQISNLNNLYYTFRLSDIEIKIQEEILIMKKNGSTYQEIYDFMNGMVAKEKIRLLCNKNGLSYFDRLNEDEIENIKNLYDDIKSIKKVSKITGYSKDTIRKYIKINKLSSDEIKQNKINSVISWRKRTKIKLVEYKGGKCEICGYDKIIQALEFHHLDPNEKDFTISGKSWSFEKLKNEVDKCILLCANCHKEIHNQINPNLS